MAKHIYWYQTASGRRPFGERLLSLNDKRARHQVTPRLDRMILGHFGDTKRVGAGVLELRIHFGPGYRVYFGLEGLGTIILLCGGDKSSQRRDIQTAQTYWADYQRRRDESGSEPS